MGHRPLSKQILLAEPPLVSLHHAVLATVSHGYPPLEGMFLCITHPCATLLIPKDFLVRLACVKHAASVRSEPESNSNVLILSFLKLRRWLRLIWFFLTKKITNQSLKFTHSLFSFQRASKFLFTCVWFYLDFIASTCLKWTKIISDI